MTKAPIGAAAAALLFGIGGAPAMAQCVISGTSGTCTGTITTAVDEDIDGLSLDVPGDILVTDDDAVRLRGDDNSLTVSGSIEATGSGDEGVQADGENFSLVNSGTITAGDKGVQAEEAGTTIVNSGTILSGDEGIEAGADVDITNSGTITAAEDGIQYGSGTFLNTGTVTGGSSGDGDAIDIDSGTVTNEGTLESLGAGSAGIDVDEETVDGDPVTELLTILNAGVIEGALGILVEPMGVGGVGTNDSVQRVINSGTLRGNDGIAAALGGGDDIFDLLAGSVVEGDVLLGAGDDRLFVGAGVGVLSDTMFDGGAGARDTLVLGAGVTAADVTFTPTSSLAVRYDDAAGPASFVIDGFERVSFTADDSLFVLASDGTLAPVPLPAGLPLLVAAGGLMAWVGRRARRGATPA